MERIFHKINRYFYGKWHIAVLDLERGRWINEPDIRYIPYLLFLFGQFFILDPIIEMFDVHFF